MELYVNGLSIAEIGKRLGKGKTVVRNALAKQGVETRPKISRTFSSKGSAKGKTNLTLPFGFRYFQGEIVPDQQEHEAMLIIHQLWRTQTNPNKIAETLNSKKIAPRRAALWNRNSINRIIERFSNGTVILTDSSYELITNTQSNLKHTTKGL